MSKDAQWKELTLKAQEGDKRAYSQLLTDISPFIRSYISASLADYDWVDDITQDVLISVHKSLHSYSSDRPFKPWLKAIISFRRTDFLRKHYKIRETKELSQNNAAIFGQKVTFQVDIGELDDIGTAISSLSVKQQKIFKMMKIEGYSAKEVAHEMNMSVSAVKVSAYRSANKLKGILVKNG